jgi:hypothetical protein
MNRVIILLLVTITAGCVAPTVNNVTESNVSNRNVSENRVLNNSVSKPTISTKPPSYLGNFPLNSVSKDQLIGNFGEPDKTVAMGDTIYLAYELGEGGEKRQYVYEISDGIVTDVKYHDQGPLNGSSARKMQKNKSN